MRAVVNATRKRCGRMWCLWYCKAELQPAEILFYRRWLSHAALGPTIRNVASLRMFHGGQTLSPHSPGRPPHQRIPAQAPLHSPHRTSRISLSPWKSKVPHLSRVPLKAGHHQAHFLFPFPSDPMAKSLRQSKYNRSKCN